MPVLTSRAARSGMAGPTLPAKPRTGTKTDPRVGGTAEQPAAFKPQAGHSTETAAAMAETAAGLQTSTVDPSVAQGLLPAGTKAKVDRLGKLRFFGPDPILGGKFVTTKAKAEERGGLKEQERLRFLREQLRRGRLSTILSSGSASEGGGLQLGRKTLLGG